VNVPEWFLTREPGDKLREIGGPEQKDDHLHHVITVFDDDHKTFIVTKTWLTSRQRWHYRIVRDTEAFVGMFYPDGEDRPKR